MPGNTDVDPARLYIQSTTSTITRANRWDHFLARCGVKCNSPRVEPGLYALGNPLEYDPNLCIGCKMCSVVYPHGMFAMNGRVAQFVRSEACMECGACQLNCPTGAITVDSGVGCAAAMIRAALLGKKTATCGPGAGASCCS
jgi:NAD-dependent dihydropyrimidine dehydrogenase PreA subunit